MFVPFKLGLGWGSRFISQNMLKLWYWTYCNSCARHALLSHTWHEFKTHNNAWPLYRVSIKYFFDYKHLLQESYVEYKLPPPPNVAQLKKFFLQHISTLQHVCLPHNFLVINVCNPGKILCSPCRFVQNCTTFYPQQIYLCDLYCLYTTWLTN
jgi:hypothetical protein